MNNLTMENLEKCFYEASHKDKKFVGIVVEMKGSPEPEVIINPTANFDSKFSYYKKTYEDNLDHKFSKDVKIVGFTYGDSYDDIQEDLTFLKIQKDSIGGN